MARAKLTTAEARQLGLFDGKPAKKKRTTKSTVPARECANTWCTKCGEEFDTIAAEDRHAATNPTHRRYESVLSERNRP